MTGAAYLDAADGRAYPIAIPRWRSDAGRPLTISEQPGITPADIEQRTRSLWRYRAALAAVIDAPISLGEGCTPLIEGAWGPYRPLFKLEWFNPTGSFKDRGASVMLSYLRQHGISAVHEDSSGNAGAALAGYGAAGGVSVRILAPATSSPGKLAQIAAHGAELEFVPGTREASAAEAIRQADRTFYASHSWQPFFLEGTKTQAYEIWEDLDFHGPDNVVISVGAGTSLLGCYLGFGELYRAGQIGRLPRLFAAQPLHCSPIDAAFKAGSEAPVTRPVMPTIAEGAAIAAPLRLRQVVAAVHDSGGSTVAIAEADIVAALQALAAQGLFVEPTSATAAAAFAQLTERGAIDAAETTVVILSGSGLKAAESVRDLIAGGR